MIIPYGTDAPIYHGPWATIGLMVATVGVFMMQPGMDPDTFQSYMLSHGEGLHPVQWLTSNFLHADVLHLIGNLLFLWAFALVVEGKVGALPFLAIYLGIGILQCALEQVLTLGMDEAGGSFGASAIVYGIMAMALVWAPKNDLSCIAFFRFRVHQFDLSILWFAALYIALEAFGVFWQGLNLSSELLHISGAAVGFVLATILLRIHWVDCEKWDLYAVWGGHTGRDKPKPSRTVRLPDANGGKGKKIKVRGGTVVADTAPGGADTRADVAADRMRRAIEEGNAVAALAYHDKARKARPDWRPTDAEWLSLIQLLASAKDWTGSVAVMEDYLQRSMKPSPRVRLRLAQILIREQKRPVHAMSVLDTIPDGVLPADLEAASVKLRTQAEQMRDDGVLELDGQAW